MAFASKEPQGDALFHQRLTDVVQASLASAATPGAAVALLLDGQPFFISGIGFCDREQTTALDAHAQFYVYSVTKSMIATTILRLVEQERVALDTAVQSYVPGLPLAASVTLRQLLNHTSGIPDYGALPAYFAALRNAPARPWTSDEFLAATLPSGLTFAAGQGWSYSNIGYLLLRQVIETVMGMSLRAALHSTIFAPLGLRHTFVAETLADVEQLPPGYSAFFSADDSLHDMRHVYHPGWVSHGVVVSTAPELARMLDSLFAGQLIGDESRAAMLAPVRVPATHPLFQQPAYGLGLMIDSHARYGTIAGHGGGGPGYAAAALTMPNIRGYRITSVGLANCDQHDLGMRLAFTLATLLGDTLPG